MGIFKDRKERKELARLGQELEAARGAYEGGRRLEAKKRLQDLLKACASFAPVSVGEIAPFATLLLGHIARHEGNGAEATARYQSLAPGANNAPNPGWRRAAREACYYFALTAFEEGREKESCEHLDAALLNAHLNLSGLEYQEPDSDPDNIARAASLRARMEPDEEKAAKTHLRAQYAGMYCKTPDGLGAASYSALTRTKRSIKYLGLADIERGFSDAEKFGLAAKTPEGIGNAAVASLYLGVTAETNNQPARAKELYQRALALGAQSDSKAALYARDEAQKELAKISKGA